MVLSARLARSGCLVLSQNMARSFVMVLSRDVARSGLLVLSRRMALLRSLLVQPCVLAFRALDWVLCFTWEPIVAAMLAVARLNYFAHTYTLTDTY